jgi:hypothetical protein
MKNNKTKRVPYNKRMTDKMEQEIIKKYSSSILSSTQLAKMFGFKTHKTILDILAKYKIKAKTPSDYTDYNIDYFEKIDTPDKAYILGLLLTDGYVIRDYAGNAIQLTIGDGYLLKRIAKILGKSASVKRIVCDTKRKKMPNAKDMIRMVFYSPKMSKDLKKWGVVVRKSKIVRFPEKIDKTMLSHFFRGLIDGDGTIGFSSKKNSHHPWCHLVSASYKFLVKAGEVLSELGFSVKVFSKPKGRLTARLSIVGGRKSIYDFWEWIYKDKGDLYLRRKYGKVQHCIGKITG